MSKHEELKLKVAETRAALLAELSAPMQVPVEHEATRIRTLAKELDDLYTALARTHWSDDHPMCITPGVWASHPESIGHATDMI